jgi:hypothetical protein
MDMGVDQSRQDESSTQIQGDRIFSIQPTRGVTRVGNFSISDRNHSIFQRRISGAIDQREVFQNGIH